MKPGDENDEADRTSICAAAVTNTDLASAFVHNERGDDFQEQMGMPDEENMRHWSHHYSTDTCDDPVFRAAMRNFSDVSFIFGLEVTWSLIQQRQQEEDEKKAILEMQALEKIQEESGDEEELRKAKAITISRNVKRKHH